MHLSRDIPESDEAGVNAGVAAFVDALAEYVADLLLDGRLDAMRLAHERDGVGCKYEIDFTNVSTPSSNDSK